MFGRGGNGDAEIRMTASYVRYRGAFELEAAGAVGVVLWCGAVML